MQLIDISAAKPGMVFLPDMRRPLPAPFNVRKTLTAADITFLIGKGIPRIGVDMPDPFEDTLFDTMLSIGGGGQEDAFLEEQGFTVSISDFAEGHEIPVDLYLKDRQGRMRKLVAAGVGYTEEMKEVIDGINVETLIVPESQRRRYDLYHHIVEQERKAHQESCFEGKYEEPEAVEKHHHFMESYYPISPVSLAPGAKLDFDLFEGNDDEVVQLLPAGKMVHEEHIDRWTVENVNLLIERVRMGHFEEYLKTAQKLTKNPRTKATLVRESSKLIVSGLAHNPRSAKLMGAASESVEDMTRSVMENPTTFYGLMKVNNHDYYTFTHSVNVSTLTLALAMELGMKNKKELADLALGALLHDIGKAAVDTRLINKPGKLTDDEFVAVKGHVMLGYEMLKGNQGISEAAFYPLLQHHEKLTGNGYPNKLPAEKIHLFGRIASIIDVYDALTTERSYKKAMTPFEALSLISRNEGDFDRAVFAKLVEMIHRQEL